jgi:hypothetical protein
MLLNPFTDRCGSFIRGLHDLIELVLHSFQSYGNALAQDIGRFHTAVVQGL